MVVSGSADSARPQDDGAVGNRHFRAPVRIRVFLVAAEDDHVAGRQIVFFSRNHQLHLTQLASQIFSRAQAVRNPGHLCAGREFHSIEFHPLQVIGKQLSDQNATTLFPRDGFGSIHSGLGFWRTDQLFDRDLQRGGDFGQHRNRRVGRARFQVGLGGARHP